MKHILNTLILLTIINANCQEVIPFELKEDNRIYIEVSINQSETLKFAFDLGANNIVINETRLARNQVDVKFDSVVLKNGTNGFTRKRISKRNSLRVGKNTYTQIDILGISYPEDDSLDGTIGWNFFHNKIVGLNYESKELTLYDELPKLSETYNKTQVKFINDLPHVETTIHHNSKKVKIWSMLDIGYKGEFLIHHDEVVKNKLIDQFQLIEQATTSATHGNTSKSDRVFLPRLEINGFEIYNIPTYLMKTEQKSPKIAQLGGNLLKRFHTVIDFKKGEAYIKPNNLINSQF